MNTITLRIPDRWAGCLDSATVRQWLGEYLQRPTPDLPADPGGGESRVTLALPKRAIKIVSGLLDCSESAALRRIIAANVGALPAAQPRYALPAAGRADWPRRSVDRENFAIGSPLANAAEPGRDWDTPVSRESGFDPFYGAAGGSPEPAASFEAEPERMGWVEVFQFLPWPFQVLIVGFAGYVLYLFLGGRAKASPTSGVSASPLHFKPWSPKP